MKYAWDEITGEWKDTTSAEITAGWSLIATHGPVNEYRSERGHMAFEVEAPDADAAEVLVIQHANDRWIAALTGKKTKKSRRLSQWELELLRVAVEAAAKTGEWNREGAEALARDIGNATTITIRNDR